MTRTNGAVHRIKIGFGLVLLAAVTGCIGFVDGGYGVPVLVPEPPVFFYGGFYDHGRDVHAYSHRGYESRGAAHRGWRR